MEKIINVAQYIFTEYRRITGEVIDEMKLHKLLYFAFFTENVSEKFVRKVIGEGIPPLFVKKVFQKISNI